MKERNLNLKKRHLKINTILKNMVVVEERNGIKCRYLNAQNGMRVYLLPNVPMDAGEIPVQEDLSESKINEFMKELKFTQEQSDRARRIVGDYRGRHTDALSVLGYAKEQGDKLFDSFATKLEERKKDFETIHPDLMYARTDVMAFFLGLYADLGKAPVTEAEQMEKLVKEHGPGVIVLPKKQ
jgi:hypothetical protein